MISTILVIVITIVIIIFVFIFTILLIMLCYYMHEPVCVQARVTWFSVWEYALQEVQVAAVLRRLLDDAHMSVVTAAAEAMAVLVGPGTQEEEAWEAAHCNPGTGRWTSDCACMTFRCQGTGIIL